MLKHCSNFLYDFSIFRIVGNDLPPRDTPGSRIKVLKFILDNEPEFTRTHKGWIINCIHDIEYRDEICKLLRKYDAYYVVSPMARKKYLAAQTRREKILHSIPINFARNTAIRFGKTIAKYTAVLDGDCYFDKQTWEEITSFIMRDGSRKHYSVPHTRSTTEHVLKSTIPLGPLSEPMPIFRYDATINFDETIPFGEGDKLKFLYKLGHSQEPFKGHILLHENDCKVIGHVHHLATGDELTETDQKHRVALRTQSIDKLIHQLDTFVPKQRKPNEFWKTIQGWFDFQGLYSHFVFDADDNATFVEVGSWMGASTCYLAQEIVNREKNIKVYAVDTWDGSEEDVHKEIISSMKVKNDTIFDAFNRNIKNAKLNHIITPIRRNSIEASQMFEDNSLDVVFIDASHTYNDVLADIRHWLPKVKHGGKIGGHDYVPGHPTSTPGVVKAVNQIFKCKELEISPAGRTWIHHKK